jgi:murein DD-endopeptidase MepM/ murein hydrolase activator NlpD
MSVFAAWRGTKAPFMALSRSKRSISSQFSVLLGIVAAGCTIAAFILFFEGGKPVVNLDQTGDHLGGKAIIRYAVSDAGSGLRGISIMASQDNVSKVLHSLTFPRSGYLGKIGPEEATETVSFDIKKEGFRDGPMRISFSAADYSWRGWLQGNRTVIEKEVTVDTIPPQLQILQSEKYISPGGAGIAIYRLTDGQGGSSGVTVNGRFSPGFPIGNGAADTYLAYFALPFDAQRIDSLAVSAVDPAGNQTIVPFTTVFKGVEQKRDTITIGETFLSAKIPEFQQYYPEMQGELIDKYLYANTTVRDQNNSKITDLCRNPTPKRLWRGNFARMAGSSRAGFADHRSYVYNGTIIDNQVHLGMDIASTNRAEVRAANIGKVIFADYLGIYGNMILVDHGQGIVSLYSHLSKINVAPGANVDKKTVIGLTGTTGMAGGDHLHFSILVNGVFVTPKEWWDQHWIDVTIEAPMAGLKF